MRAVSISGPQLGGHQHLSMSTPPPRGEAEDRAAGLGWRPGGWTWAERALKVTGRARRAMILHWFEIILQGFKTYGSPPLLPLP